MEYRVKRAHAVKKELKARAVHLGKEVVKVIEVKRVNKVYLA